MVRKLFKSISSRLRKSPTTPTRFKKRTMGFKSKTLIRRTVGKKATRAASGARKTGKMYKKILINKNPSRQIPIVSKISGAFDRLRSKLKLPLPRDGKRSQNAPSIFERFKGRLPKILPTFPKIKIPFAAGAGIALMGLQNKIQKFGFPKINLPDVGGLFKGKLDDITGIFGKIAETIAGKAGDFKEKRDRKKMIRRIVLAVIAILIGMLIWKKVK